MNAKPTTVLLAALSLGAAVISLAGPCPSYWQRLRTTDEFKQLKAGDKVLYVCNQCEAVTEQTIATPAQAMEHCKEGATVTCPNCREKVRIVFRGPPKNQTLTREVTYTNSKGEPCFFVAKAVEKK